MKILSLSIWGPNPRYKIGALKNIELARKIFPEWKVFLYTDSELKIDIEENIKVIVMRGNSLNGSFWRFFPFFESEGYVLSRDADSRLSYREKQAADEWIESGKGFSIIKDHPRHFDFPILAGMWGARTPLNKNLLNRMLTYSNRHNYLIDQEFLTKEIWPIAANSCLIHSMNDKSWFGSTRSSVGLNFIGQGYDENDNPIYPKG